MNICILICIDITVLDVTAISMLSYNRLRNLHAEHVAKQKEQ